MSNQLAIIANRLQIEESEIKNIVMNTIMPNGGKGVTNEQFVSFLTVANEYNLNPLTKEIYAFPSKGGGVQPLVSVDGWIKVINSQPDFDGMTLISNFDDKGKIESATCKIFVKGREHPTEITEYLSECDMGTTQWKQRPVRMLRHAAAKQAGRYAFGLSGLLDLDDAKRQEKEFSQNKERDITPEKQDSGTINKLLNKEKPKYNLDRWLELIKKCADIDSLKAIYEKAAKDAMRNGSEEDRIKITQMKDEVKGRLNNNGTIEQANN